jgi:hypothetical protein
VVDSRRGEAVISDLIVGRWQSKQKKATFFYHFSFGQETPDTGGV